MVSNTQYCAKQSKKLTHFECEICKNDSQNVCCGAQLYFILSIYLFIYFYYSF